MTAVTGQLSPQWDEKLVAYGLLWSDGLVWLAGVVVCLLAANRRGQWMAA